MPYIAVLQNTGLTLTATFRGILNRQQFDFDVAARGPASTRKPRAPSRRSHLSASPHRQSVSLDKFESYHLVFGRALC
jgi:hypothetical protein